MIFEVDNTTVYISGTISPSDWNKNFFKVCKIFKIDKMIIDGIFLDNYNMPIINNSTDFPVFKFFNISCVSFDSTPDDNIPGNFLSNFKLKPLDNASEPSYIKVPKGHDDPEPLHSDQPNRNQQRERFRISLCDSCINTKKNTPVAKRVQNQGLKIGDYLG